MFYVWRVIAFIKSTCIYHVFLCKTANYWLCTGVSLSVFVWAGWHLARRELWRGKIHIKSYCTSRLSFLLSSLTHKHTQTHCLAPASEVKKSTTALNALTSSFIMSNSALLRTNGSFISSPWWFRPLIGFWWGFPVSHVLTCQATIKFSSSAQSKHKQESKHKHIKHKLNYVSSHSCGLTLT